MTDVRVFIRRPRWAACATDGPDDTRKNLLSSQSIESFIPALTHQNMTNDLSVANIFSELHAFIIDYVKLLQVVSENSLDADGTMLTIKVAEGVFPLPATFHRVSQRADELAHRLQRQGRIIAQQRRRDISQGVDDQIERDSKRTRSFTIEDSFRSHVNELQSKISNRDLRVMLRYAQVILDSFDLYEEMKSTKRSLNITFRLLPILHHIQKQVGRCAVHHAVARRVRCSCAACRDISSPNWMRMPH